MTLQTLLIIYIAGFVLIQIVVHMALRSEPTAHGQIVGRSAGVVAGLLWPIVAPVAAIALLVFGIRAALVALHWWDGT